MTEEISDQSFTHKSSTKHEYHPLSVPESVTDGRLFALITQHAKIPHNGVGYIVELFEDESMQVIAYIDGYNRIFDATETLCIPPARYARMRFTAADSSYTGEIYCIDNDNVEHSIGTYTINFAEDNGKQYSVIQTPVASCDIHHCSYKEFMAQAFLQLYYIPKLTGYKVEHIRCEDILNILDGYNLFEALHILTTRVHNAQKSDTAHIEPLVTWLVAALDATELSSLTYNDMRIAPDADAPEIHLVHNDASIRSYFIAMEPELMTEKAEQSLYTLESFLNRFSIMHGVIEETNNPKPITLEDIFDLDDTLCDTLGSAYQAHSDIFISTTINDLTSAHKLDSSNTAYTKSEFDSRLSFAQACEAVTLPFRTDIDFRINARDGYAAIQLTTIPEAAFKFATYDKNSIWQPCSAKECYERMASHIGAVSVLFAGMMFGKAHCVHTLYFSVAQPRTSGGTATVLSYTCTKDDLFNASSTPNINAWKIIKQLDYKTTLEAPFDIHDEAQSISPHASIHDALFCPPEYYHPVSEVLPNRILSKNQQELLHVRNLNQLSIFEEATRLKFANRVIDALDISIDKAVKALHDIHDQTEDLSLRATCQALISGFSDNTLDEMSFLEIKEAFRDIYGFQSLFTAMNALNDSDREGKRAYLNEVLAIAERKHLFVDTDSVCYRNFTTYTSRMLYAHACDDSRTVLPLADEIFAAHSLLALSYYDSFEAADKGLEHAQACIKLAPSEPDGYRHAARIYFMLGDFASEIRECQNLIRISTQRSDLALAFYWMAFAYWKTGNPVLGAICYKRSIVLDPLYRQESQAELEELKEENPHLLPLSYTEEDNELRRAGVPIDDIFNNAIFLLSAARIWTDAGCFKLAQALLASAISILNDDTLYLVIHSLDD